MNKTKQDFQTRKIEIDNYFNFLSIFDDDETKLQYKKGKSIVIEKIQPEFQVILIANAFLILYNLIESTVRNSIVEIYSHVEEEDIAFGKLSEKLQKIWIKKEIADKLKENKFRPETLQDYIFKLAQDILNKETIKLSNVKMDFSGNLDAAKIRELAQKIGFDEPANGRNLAEIKTKRNRLAHGEQTFYDVGKDFSVKELTDLKDETFNYLINIIDKIESYIFAKKYTL